jgi:hypothetical protein|tara:strand:+ start:13760 stop:14467 length:708 start_codon:yes stop_codon:yes gene_type:complete
MSTQDSQIKVNKEDSNYLDKRQQTGGLFLGFVFVLMLSSIMALALWVNQISTSSQELVNSYEDRIALLEEQLSIVDSVNADSMTGVASQLQFLDKEIRKLWDLSNKRNKVKIEETESLVKDLKNKLKSLQDSSIKLNKLAISNQSKIKDHIKQLELVASTLKSLPQLQKDIKSLNTDILLMEESIQAFNNYRKQNNAVILQLQNEIRLLKASIITSNNPSTNNNNSLVDLEIIEE